MSKKGGKGDKDGFGGIFAGMLNKQLNSKDSMPSIQYENAGSMIFDPEESMMSPPQTSRQRPLNTILS